MTGTATDWTGGYVVDVAYVNTFLAGLVPLNLAMAAAVAGVRPPDMDAPFAYLDLGCGNGFTPALVAAAHRHAQVWGNDFNPAHIRTAREIAEAAGVDNVRFVEASFAELPDAAPPQFDVIVAHGIWSWIGADNRAHVAALLGRYLKPGGIAAISYNCHPGWDAVLPLRRLLTVAGGSEGTSVERVARALAVARRLRDAGADYFRNSAAARDLLDQIGRADPAYVAHEYINRHWTLFHAREVAEALAPHGLQYVGQARISDNLDRFWLSGDERALLGEAGAGAEEMRDLMLDRRFRRDLFVKGAADRSAGNTAAWFVGRRFVLARPRAACSLAFDTRLGRVDLPSAVLDAVLDALARGPATVEALTGIATAAEIVDALGILAALGHVQPALSEVGEPARRAATDRFNAAALAGARMGEPAAALASPVTGSGVELTAGEQLLLDAVHIGIPLDAIAASDGTADGDPVGRFREERLPLLTTLGIA